MKLKLISGVVLGLLSMSFTHAAEINLSGFATFAGGITGGSDEQLNGYDDKFGFKANSLIAIQASSDLGNGWGVTTQILSRGSDDWKTDAEWAYLSYDASDNWRLLFGRQRAPFYMYSDYLDVSYAYHWIKPPTGVYSLPFDVFEGIGSIYNNSLGDWDSTIQISYGRNTDEFTLFGQEVSPNFRDFFAASWSLNYDYLTLRGSYAQTTYSIPVSDLVPLTDGWRSAGFDAVAQNLEAIDDDAWFAGFGAIIDYNDYLLISEYTELHPGNNLFADQKSWYVSAGMRFENKLLHLTLGADTGDADSILGGGPAGVDPGLDFLIASTMAVQSGQEEDSQYVTLGLRWDVSDSVAFKAEYTDFTDDMFGNDSNLIQMALVTVF